MEISYPYLSEKQIKIIKDHLIPEFNAKSINNYQELQDAESNGFEWLEIFEDLGIGALSHISNNELGLKDDATQDDRDKVFKDQFTGSGGEWNMVLNLIWEWLETGSWDIKETNILNSEIIIPDWFNKKIYDEGDIVKNSYGVKIELNNVELSLYKCFLVNKLKVNTHLTDPSIISKSEFEENKEMAHKIYFWFNENNKNAFRTLFKA